MPDHQTTKLEIPLRTLLKVTGFLLLLVSLYFLGPLLLVFFLALLIAMALEPLLVRLQKYVPRWLALLGVLGTLGAATAALMILIVPPLLDQLNRVVQRIPAVAASLLNHIPQSSVIYQVGDKILKNPRPDLESWVGQILSVGQVAMGGVASIVLIYVLMIYLLIDGRNTYQWLAAFFSPGTQTKLKTTVEEITQVVSAYMIGQVMTSVLCAIFVYGILVLLKVPGALMLGVIAGVFDILPIIGFFLSIIPSVIFALTVSPSTALIVFTLYLGYHALENYILVPMIYGNRLRLSGLAVLIAILVGATLGGVLGAIIILPVIASYPIVERHWLVEWIGERTVTKHQELEG